MEREIKVVDCGKFVTVINGKRRITVGKQRPDWQEEVREEVRRAKSLLPERRGRLPKYLRKEKVKSTPIRKGKRARALSDITGYSNPLAMHDKRIEAEPCISYREEWRKSGSNLTFEEWCDKNITD